jgi:hypothetical protein
MVDSLSKLSDFGPIISRIEDLCRKSWEPSEAQEVKYILSSRGVLTNPNVIQKLLKQLLRHYVIKPVSSYKCIANLVKVCPLSFRLQDLHN